MANDARNSMTRDSKVYRRLRINGREFKLVPRSDGRFNLIAEGQRGAAGSTAIIGRREGKQIINRLRSIEGSGESVKSANNDSRTVTFETYFEGSQEDASLFEGELIPEYNAGNIDDVYGNNGNDSVVAGSKTGNTLDEESFSFESTPEGDVFVGKELSIRYPAGTVAVNSEGFTEKIMMDGDVEFNDEDSIPEELVEQFNRGERITVSDVIATFAVTGGIAVGRYGDKKLTSLNNTMQSYGLKKLHESLMEIRHAAKNDLIGAPVLFATGGAIGLTRKAANMHRSRMSAEKADMQKADSRKVAFWRSENQKAWSGAKAMEASKIFDEEKKPLLDELNSLTEQVAVKKDLATKIRLMESHPVLQYSDEELAGMKREAAANRDFYKLAQLKALDERVATARTMYGTIRKQYDSMPDVQTFTRNVTETKQKIRAVDSKIVKTRNARLTQADMNNTKILPYGFEGESFSKKMNSLKGADLRNSLIFALMGGAKVLTKRNRYLRLAENMS